MIEHNILKCVATDGKSLHVNLWNPKVPVQCVVLLIHGMAEHSGRYGYLAEKLASKGIALVGYDQRGHGQSVTEEEVRGFIAKKNGWELLLSDLDDLIEYTKSKFPEIPLYMMGHSMGAILLMNHMETRGAAARGYLFSSLTFKQEILSQVGMIFSKTQSIITQKTAEGKIQNTLSFAAFNRKFKPNRTDFDWLSRDQAEVDKYINDPLCGGVFTAQFFYDLSHGVSQLYKNSSLAKLPQSVPVFFLFGSEDPVAGGEKKIFSTLTTFKNSMNKVSYEIYEGARHELVNETNKDEIIVDIIQWIERYEKEI